MSVFCVHCGRSMPDTAGYCPNCGRPAPQTVQSASAGVSAVAQPATGLSDNVAGMLAYFTFIPALLFLLVDPYNRRPFVRFHSFQSLFLSLAFTLLWWVFTLIPIIGLLFLFLLLLGAVITWIVLMIKAYGGERFKLPVIGDLAEKQV
jgi:uncharacterized membrane protein